MIMFGVCIVSVHKLPLHIFINRKPSAHAQMHKEPFTRGELRLQEFGAPRQRGQRRPLYALNKSICEWKAQIRAVELDVVENETFHDGDETPLDGFDFREFWHEAFLIFDAGRRK